MTHAQSTTDNIKPYKLTHAQQREQYKRNRSIHDMSSTAIAWHLLVKERFIVAMLLVIAQSTFIITHYL